MPSPPLDAALAEMRVISRPDMPADLAFFISEQSKAVVRNIGPPLAADLALEKALAEGGPIPERAAVLVREKLNQADAREAVAYKALDAAHDALAGLHDSIVGLLASEEDDTEDEDDEVTRDLRGALETIRDQAEEFRQLADEALRAVREMRQR